MDTQVVADKKFTFRGFFASRLKAVAAFLWESRSMSIPMGLAVGIAVFICGQTWLAANGAYALSLSMMLAALALGVWLFDPKPVAKSAGRFARLKKHQHALCLAGILPLVPLLSAASLELLALAPLPEESAWLPAMFLIPAALLVISLPCLFACGIARTTADRTGSSFGFFCGMSLGCVGCALLADAIAPVFLIAAASLILAGTSLWMMSRDAENSATPVAKTAGVGHRIALPLLLASGMIVVVIERILTQLVPLSPQQFWANCGFLLLGVAIGKRLRLNPATTAVCLAGSCLALFGGFDMWIRMNLSINGVTSSPGTILFLRALQGVWLIPAGIAAANLVPATKKRLGVPIFVCGAIATLVALSLGVSAGVLAFVLVSALCLGAAAIWLPHPKRVWKISTAAVIFVAGFSIWNYDPSRPARLLFSTTILHASKLDLSLDLLAAVEDTRPVMIREGNRGTISVLRSRAAQWRFRESGLPRGVAASGDRIYPRHSGVTLPVLLPLAMHEEPENILMLGAGSGSQVDVALQVSGAQLHLVEPDSALWRVLKKTALEHRDVAEDPRLHVRHLPTEWAVRLGKRKYDVVLSFPPTSPGMTATSSYSPANFRAISRRLSEHGLFALSLVSRDLGAANVRSITAAVRSAFDQVAVMEIVPGELIVLGTNSELGFARVGLLERLQTPQTRRMLAECGTDWMVVLNLPMMNPPTVDEFLAGGNKTTSIWQSRLSFQLTTDIARWANKHKELTDEIAKTETGRSRLLEQIADEENQPSLEHRLKEIALQRKIQMSSVDHPLHYRAAVRKHLTQTKRREISHAKGALAKFKVHPEDRRRMDYFRALEAAVAEPSAESVAALERFAKPYDPLISPFLPGEVARIYERLGKSFADKELKFRLYEVHFAGPTDRSLRNVSRALELSVNSRTNSPRETFDTLNGLMQTLLLRCQNRWQKRPLRSVERMSKDAGLAITAAEEAMRRLDRLADRAEIPASVWKPRRQFLNANLIGPLRMHSEQLTAQLRALERDRKKETGDEPKLPGRDFRPIAN